MLKTNSNIVKANILNYCFNSIAASVEYETGIKLKLARASVYPFIYRKFKKETSNEYNKQRPESVVFSDWAAGLACYGLFDYIAINGAADVVAKILDETPEESARFTETAAADFLTALIYREVVTNK